MEARPSANGCPSWLAAMLVQNWADRNYPLPIKRGHEECGRCRMRTEHTKQNTCSGLVLICQQCGRMRVD